MILASHVIFFTYGFWLPNDPRGSWSDFVGAWNLLPFGLATKTSTRRSVAGARHDQILRRDAKAALKHDPVAFTGLQARAVGRGFAHYVEGTKIEVWACSILPKHVHMVIKRHKFEVEYIVNQLKGHATRRLATEQLHPASPRAWGRGMWKVYLSNSADIRRAVRYVENNSLKEGLPPQKWSFVHPPSFNCLAATRRGARFFSCQHLPSSDNS
jgi:REP element-mobilizing transposase RayT